MRLFFALFPDAGTRKQLLSQASAVKLAGRARLVADANLHMTLAFVGEVSNSDLRVFRAMGAALRLRRCVIDLNALEHWTKPEALVLTARGGDQELAMQAEHLRAAVARTLGPTRAQRSWRAHLTLARKVTQAPVLTQMSPISGSHVHSA